MSVTLYLIIITSAISLLAFKNQKIKYKFIFSPYYIYKNKDFPRFISSGFIHGDIYHLLFNMLALHSFGENMESIYAYYFSNKANTLYLILYIGGIIMANIPAFIKHRKNYHYFSLGASGGISAVVFSCILFSPNSLMCIFGLISLPSIVFGILYIIFVIYLTTNNITTTTNHIAHVWGGLFGVIYNIILEPKILPYFIYEIKHLKLF